MFVLTSVIDKDEKRYTDEWSVATEDQSGILARKQKENVQLKYRNKNRVFCLNTKYSILNTIT